MDFSTQMLARAALEERRLNVIAPEGRLPGYLIGLDATHMVLYAWFRKDGENGVWSIVVVPRTMVVTIDDIRLDSEPADVRKTYSGIAQPFLDAFRVKLFGKDAE